MWPFRKRQNRRLDATRSRPTRDWLEAVRDSGLVTAGLIGTAVRHRRHRDT